MLVVLDQELAGLDRLRLLHMAVIHDLAEAVCGDIPAVLQQADDTKSHAEQEAMQQLTALLPAGYRETLLELWEEYETGSSSEARFLKGLDKLETILQHNQGCNAADFDYAFNLHYGQKYMLTHPLLAALRQHLDAVTTLRVTAGSRSNPNNVQEASKMTVTELVAHFDMHPHPEGGFFRETYRSSGTVSGMALPAGYAAEGHGGTRSFSTAIVYLLRQGEYSHLHRIRQDEVWHFYLGGPLRLVSLSPEGEICEILLGTDLARGQRVQHVVPGGYWFGATPAPEVPFALVGCAVAPGFEFADFEMGERLMLERAFPAARNLVHEFTVSGEGLR